MYIHYVKIYIMIFDIRKQMETHCMLKANVTVCFVHYFKSIKPQNGELEGTDGRLGQLFAQGLLESGLGQQQSHGPTFQLTYDITTWK